MCPRKALLRRVTVDTHFKPVMQEEQRQLEEGTFPFKLYEMLEYASDSEFSSCISWSANGRAFVINDKDVLMKHLAPKFFKQTKFRSFTRQLNMWGFFRTETLGGKGDSWRHNNFLRGQPRLLKEIERTQTMRKSSSSAKAQALSRQAQMVAVSMQNAAFLADQSNWSSSQVVPQAFRSSNEGDSNNFLDSARVSIQSAAASQPSRLHVPQDQGAVFRYFSSLNNGGQSYDQDSISTLLTCVQRSSIETQVGSTEHSSEMSSNRHVADTISSSTNRVAQPFDELELSFIANIFEREDNRPPEEDLFSILSLDQEAALEDFSV